MKKLCFNAIYIWLCLLVCNNNLIAQTLAPLIMSTGSPDHVANLPSGYINSAMIDYSPNCPSSSPCAATHQQLKVIASQITYGYYPITQVFVDDGYDTISFFVNGAGADVIVGNDINNTSNYKIGIVYSVPSIPENMIGAPFALNSCYGLNNIYLEVWTVAFVGAGLGTLALSSTGPILISTNKHTSNEFPHIDILTDYFNMATTSTTIGGLPICDTFVITWTDNYHDLPWTYMGGGLCLSSFTTPPNIIGSPDTVNLFGVNHYLASLASPTGGIYRNNHHAPSTSTVQNADVALVQRHVGIGKHTVAYFTYTDNSNHLFEDEIDFDVASNSSRKFIASNMFAMPRIDAIDNYHYNNSSGPIYNFDYLIVDNDINTGIVWETPGFMGSLSTTTLLNGWATPLFDQMPSVTCGAGNYNVGFYHPDGVNEYITAPPTNWNAASYIGLSPIIYYATNNTPVSAAPLYQNIISLSSTCNNDNTFSWSNPPEIFSCWNNMGNVYYKEAPDVFGWKNAHPTAVANHNTLKEWTIYPTPAKNYLNLLKPAQIENANYVINDISGKEMSAGLLAEENNTINISNLSAGVYFISITQMGNGNAKEVKHFKFEKE